MAHVDVVVSAMTRHGDVAAVVEACLAYLANEAAEAENVEALVSHVDAVVSAMSRHSDVEAVMEQGLLFLATEATAAENRAALMAHVDAVVSVMAHGDVAAVVARGLSFLHNLAFAPANRVPLMAHVDMVVSAMARHGDSGQLCEWGVYFLDKLSQAAANIPVLKAAGVADAVRQVIADHGSVGGVGVKRSGEALLGRLR